MPIPAHRQIHIALSHDLNRSGASPVIKVADDAGRKIFTAMGYGGILEFPYKQADENFWNGMKYYSSGTRNKIRFPRTQGEAA